MGVCANGVEPLEICVGIVARSWPEGATERWTAQVEGDDLSSVTFLEF